MQFFATPPTRIGYIYLGLLRRKVASLGPVDKPDPASDAAEQHEAEEAAGGLVIACGDPALFFEVADAALDA